MWFYISGPGLRCEWKIQGAQISYWDSLHQASSPRIAVSESKQLLLWIGLNVSRRCQSVSASSRSHRYELRSFLIRSTKQTPNSDSAMSVHIYAPRSKKAVNTRLWAVSNGCPFHSLSLFFSCSTIYSLFTWLFKAFKTHRLENN